MESSNILPALMMMMSKQGTSTDNNNGYIYYIFLFLSFFLPMFNRLVPFEEIREYIIDFFKRDDDFVELVIPTHIVKKTKSWQTTPTEDFIVSPIYININKRINDSFASQLTIKSCREVRNINNNNKKENSEENFMFAPIENGKKNKLCDYEGYVIYYEYFDDKVKSSDDDNDKNDKNKKSKDIKNPTIRLLTKQIKTGKISSIKVLMNFVEENNLKYDESLKQKNILKYFRYTGGEQEDDCLILKFESNEMKHNKILGYNVFLNSLEEQNYLLELIEPYIYDEQNNTIHPRKIELARLGIAQKLTFLLHGPPGCGKSSFLKGLAKKTNRHIVSANMSQFKTSDEFIKFIRVSKINGENYSSSKLIISFEDCDATKNNILKKRSNDSDNSEEHSKNSKPVESGLTLENLITSTVKISNINNNDLNLTDILQELDGVNELNDIIIVFSTNHFEMLDPAFIRAGRMDQIIYFDYASQNLIKRILIFVFELSEKDISKYLSQINIIQDNILSVAEIMKVVSTNKITIEQALDKILILSQNRDR